jgi:hypothetical protein
MIRDDRDQRGVEELLAPQPVQQLAQSIVDEAQRGALGVGFAVAIEPAPRR